MSQSAVLAARMDLPPPVPPRGPEVPARRPAPPPPAADISSRFRFHKPDEFPPPEAMVIPKKLYPSQQSSTRRQSVRASVSSIPAMREGQQPSRSQSTRKTRPPPPVPDDLSTQM